jgi:hypothetical protein
MTVTFLDVPGGHLYVPAFKIPTTREPVVTELGGTQISSLMEVLPGIAQVLRSPVADAIVNLIRAACRVREFDLADAEEMLKYAVRRNLMAAEESERVLAEARAILQRRAERAAERERPKKPAPRPGHRAKSKGKGPRKTKASSRKAPHREK